MSANSLDPAQPLSSRPCEGISPGPPLDIERFSSTLVPSSFYVDGLVDESESVADGPLDRRRIG